MKKRKTARKTSTKGKTKNNSMKYKKMSLKEKEFVAITVFAVFVFAFLLATTNVPQQSVTITGHQVAEEDNNMDSSLGNIGNIDLSNIGDFLTNLINFNNADPVVIKWVLFFTFTLLIWGGLSQIGIKNGLIRAASIPVAFAMVYLLRADEIFAGLVGYSALGMTVIVMLPFIAILFFSVKLLEGRLSAAKIIAQLMIWYFYLAFLIYYLFRAISTPKSYNSWILLIIGIGILMSAWFIWKNKWWRQVIADFGREGAGKAIEDVQDALGVEEKAKSEKLKQHIGGAWYNRK